VTSITPPAPDDAASDRTIRHEKRLLRQRRTVVLCLTGLAAWVAVSGSLGAVQSIWYAAVHCTPQTFFTPPTLLILVPATPLAIVPCICLLTGALKLHRGRRSARILVLVACLVAVPCEALVLPFALSLAPTIGLADLAVFLLPPAIVALTIATWVVASRLPLRPQRLDPPIRG
jgi:hypothetical protein